MEHPPGAWNIAVRTRGVFTHRTGFQKLACTERGLVRTGWRGGEAACGNRWRKRISAGAGVSKQGQAQVQSETDDKRRQEQAGRGAGVSKQGQAQVQSETDDKRRQEQAGRGAGVSKQGQAQVQSETGDKRRQEQAGTGQTEQEQASASGNKRRCNQRQVAGRRRERTDGAGAGGNKREQEQAETGKCRQAPFYAEHTTRRAGQTASPPNARKPNRKVNRLPLCR